MFKKKAKISYLQVLMLSITFMVLVLLIKSTTQQKEQLRAVSLKIMSINEVDTLVLAKLLQQFEVVFVMSNELCVENEKLVSIEPSITAQKSLNTLLSSTHPRFNYNFNWSHQLTDCDSAMINNFLYFNKRDLNFQRYIIRSSNLMIKELYKYLGNHNNKLVAVVVSCESYDFIKQKLRGNSLIKFIE